MPSPRDSLSLITSSFSRVLRRQPSLSMVECLLDLYPQAAILLDLRSNRILLANAKATLVTAYTRAELTQITIDQLIPEYEALENQSDQEPGTISYTAPVEVRDGNSLEVLINQTRLGSNEDWAFITFLPVASLQQQQAAIARTEQLVNHILALVQAMQAPDFTEAAQAALEAGHLMTGAEFLCLYLADSGKPGLHQETCYGDTLRFPGDIQHNEMSAAIEPYLWLPGKRPFTELQRYARPKHLAYLACAALGQPGALNGVIAIADRTLSPPEDILSLLRVLAAALTTIVQHHSLTSNLEEIEKNQQYDLTIGQIIKESVQEGVILASPDLTILELNPTAEWTLGYASREVVGEPIENVLIGAENLILAVQSVLRGEPMHNMGNVHLHRRDGISFLAHVRTLPIMMTGELYGVVILIRDLSEHEQFQIRNQQLEQRALLGEITAIFAHEVRNPINNLSTGLQLMAMNLPADDPGQELIARMEQDCNRLTQLMQSVLSFSHTSDNRHEPVDLGWLIERLLDRWRPRLARLNVQYSLSNNLQNRSISGDPRSLEQVFNNLIGNAVQAMNDTGGTLSINLRVVQAPGEREQVEISVSDNGPGIPEDIRDRIFEPFFTTNREGTGLGLAIAKRIITAHKGTINVTSIPGATVFQVILPVSGSAEDDFHETPVS
jgi:two-component system sensor histidine kinase AtoS